MKFKEFKIYVVIISFVISLSILIAGNWLYEDIYINNPLSVRIKEISAIKEYNFIETDDETYINVELNANSDLKDTYLSITSAVNSVKGKENNIKIKIKDNPNDKLTDYWGQVQFAVYQALEQGDYTNMVKILTDKANHYNFSKCKIDMDDSRIYVQINNNNNFLYKVIKRNG